MNNTKKALVLAAVALVALVGYKVATKTAEPTPVVSGTPETTTTPAPVATNPTTEVVKRTLSTKVTYTEPAGTSDMGIALVLDETGVITDVSIDVLAIHDVSKQLQTAFAGEIAGALKGKKLADLTAIDRLGGASLTTKAFNDALATLKAQM